MKDLKKDMMALLDEYEHRNSDYGVQAIIDEWKRNKAGLIAMFSNHPNWDADNYRIVFSTDYERGFDRDAISKFADWALHAWIKMQTPRRIDGMKVGEYKRMYRLLEEAQGNLDWLRGLGKRLYFQTFPFEITATISFNGDEYSTFRQLLETMSDKYAKVIDETASIYDDRYDKATREQFDKLGLFFRDMADNATGNLMTEELVDRVNEIFPQLKAVVGQKIMKVIRKVCVMHGLDKIVDVKEETYLDQNGNVRTRTKDFGYNGQIASLGDKVNPLKIRRHTVISLNPLDYLTMSFGHNWASCHTIDKTNKRGISNSHYNGCYCSGTLSYLLDGASVIFYTVDSAYDGKDFETQDKMQRCMFHLNEDGTVMVQGRVYPDGRDNGDAGYAGQFRNIMQTVVATCLNHNNLWVCRRGTCEIGNITSSRGTHYRDYTNYDDCTVSLLKGMEDYRQVIIGHKPICPSCGEVHTSEEYLCCDECQGAHTCARCGNSIDPDDFEAIEIDGEWFCCDDCALIAGYVYTSDDGWHNRDDCFCDDYDGEWYYGEPEVATEDGHYYIDYDNAYNGGYMRTENGEWYPESEVYLDEFHDRYFHWTDDSVEIDGRYFEDEDDAKDAGFIMYDGEWYAESDMVTDAVTGEMFPSDLDGAVYVEEDNVWFVNEDEARETGYYQHSDGEWYKEEEEAA